MDVIGTRSWHKAAAAAFAAVGLAAMLGACAKDNSAKSDAIVRPGDFAGTYPAEKPLPELPAPKMPVIPVGEATITKTLTPAVVTIGGAGSTPPPPASSGAAQPLRASQPQPSAAPDLTTTVGSPPSNAAARPTERPLVIDAVVGQVNGRPVVATEILEPLDGELRARSVKARSLEQWKSEAGQLIADELLRRVHDELILSEAHRSLTPEQKAGLLHFLQQAEGYFVSQSQGSQVKADEASRENNGRTLKQESQDVVDQELIRNELNTKVEPRVMVPWRDVQNEYDRRQDKYHTPAKYTFKVIFVSIDNTDAIAKIKADLAGGAKFVDVAFQPYNTFYAPSSHATIEASCNSPQSDCAFMGYPPMNAAMGSLAVGTFAVPIDFNDASGHKMVGWVYLEKLDAPKDVSLYDAQIQIEAELRQDRLKTEQQRYFDRLMRRANVTNEDLVTMIQKMVDIAADRYAGRFLEKP